MQMKRTIALNSDVTYYLQLLVVTVGVSILTVLPVSMKRRTPAFWSEIYADEATQDNDRETMKNEAIIDQLMKRIIIQESSGDSSAINLDSGALGLGQVMPDNLPGWSQEALGRQVSVEEFLASAEVQQQIIRFKLAQYWQSAIAQTADLEIACQRVAATWYSGDPTLYQNVTPQIYKGRVYPSIADYSLSVCSGFEATLTAAKQGE